MTHATLSSLQGPQHTGRQTSRTETRHNYKAHRQRVLAMAAPESPFKPGILRGKVALITGGGSGIGLEITRQLGAPTMLPRSNLWSALSSCALALSGRTLEFELWLSGLSWPSLCFAPLLSRPACHPVLAACRHNRGCAQRPCAAARAQLCVMSLARSRPQRRAPACPLAARRTPQTRPPLPACTLPCKAAASRQQCDLDLLG